MFSNSMTLSGGERFQVLAAAKAAKAGWNLKAILERLEKIRENTEVIYTLETLEYLARGGRIGRVQALMGSVLKIKPIIRVDHKDGKYTTVAKGRTVSQNLGVIVDHIADMYGSIPLWATVLHGRFAGERRQPGKIDERTTKHQENGDPADLARTGGTYRTRNCRNSGDAGRTGGRPGINFPPASVRLAGFLFNVIAHDGPGL